VSTGEYKHVVYGTAFQVEACNAAYNAVGRRMAEALARSMKQTIDVTLMQALDNAFSPPADPATAFRSSLAKAALMEAERLEIKRHGWWSRFDKRPRQ
jgi:hypothetical protein